MSERGREGGGDECVKRRCRCWTLRHSGRVHFCRVLNCCAPQSRRHATMTRHQQQQQQQARTQVGWLVLVRRALWLGCRCIVPPPQPTTMRVVLCVRSCGRLSWPSTQAPGAIRIVIGGGVLRWRRGIADGECDAASRMHRHRHRRQPR